MKVNLNNKDLLIKTVFIVVLSAVIISSVLILSLSRVKKDNVKEQLQLQPTIVKTANTTPPIASPRPQVKGKRLFYSSDNAINDVYTIKDGYLDPSDAKVGEKQQVSLSLKSKQPVTSVTAKITTDNGSQSILLSKVAGTVTEGNWSGSWKVNDTYDKTYIVGLRIEGASGSAQLEVRL